MPKLLLCVLVATVINVGIAWLSVVQSPIFDANSERYRTNEQGISWLYTLWRNHHVVAVIGFAVDYGYEFDWLDRDTTVENGPYWSRVRIAPTDFDIQSRLTIFEDARGWPMVCLMSECTGTPSFTSWKVVSGIEVDLQPWRYGIPRTLPVKPIWFGLAVNTAMYASIIWLLLLGASRIRRLRRVRRGCCPSCNYPRGVSEVCTECGKPHPRNISRT